MTPLEGAGTDRPATLADIAAAAGVAVSTVSRALNHPGRVNRVTRERIEQVAAELDYVANGNARALSSGRTRAIAVLIADVANPFYFGVLRGTQQQSRAAGYTQILVDTEESGELEDEVLRRLRRSYDGAVLAASRLSDRRLASLAEEIPIVALNRQTAGVPSVFIDSPSGVEQALEHLVSLGHRRIAYVSGPRTSFSNAGRWRAMRRAGARHGIDPILVGPFSSRQTAGAAAADAVLNSGVTACVAFNDLLAIGMLTRLHERGVHVPGDLSIVGCDDIFGADFCNPPLTTLTAPVEQAGRAAVAMLLARIEDPRRAPGSTTLPTHLTVRASTGPAPAPGPVPRPRSER
ncbi:LacI family transcriptional regulator [Agromyces intestinalis]|uniref:LacI family transcriptional regulator n=1 Tax=Agromyces intestinalis TaxID=2592652 RepID=A0A5C1YJI6_9MICO|nr:LacI family DNA-binding transcriptional regulator [Agromyces intestinalis]QEO15430.1 LacI family transcriptional regulator [Agromyces intestinalis]